MDKMEAGNLTCGMLLVPQFLHTTKQLLYLPAAAVLLLAVVASSDDLCIAIFKPIRKHRRSVPLEFQRMGSN